MKVVLLSFVLVASACGNDTPPATPDAGSICPPETPAASPTPPAPRAFAAGGYDADTTSFYVFGGDLAASCGATTPQPGNDTWRYAARCVRWIQLSPQMSPPARSGAASAVGSVVNGDGTSTRHLYVFGGRGEQGLLGDVWALDLDSDQWAPLVTTGTPPAAREHATLVYNGSSNKLLLFGGNSSADATMPQLLNDVWELDLNKMNTWTQLVTTGTPPVPRMMHISVYDNDTQNLVVGFGEQQDGTYLRDLYSLDQTPQMMGPPPNRWSPVSFTTGPSARIAAGAAVDPRTGRLVLFGGRDANAGPLNDLWNLSGGRWFPEIAPDTIQNASGQLCQRPADYVTARPDTPERRFGALFVWGALPDLPGNPYVFGGMGDCGALNDVWTLLEGTLLQWISLKPSDSGVSCAHAGRMGCASLCQ